MSRQPHDGTAGTTPLGVGRHAQDSRVMTSCLQTMLSSYSHRCRNSLNGIKLAQYLFKRSAGQPIPPSWVEIESTYATVERYFDRLQMIYQTMAFAKIQTGIGQWLNEHEPAWQSRLSAVGRSLVMDPPPQEVTVGFDPHYLARGFDELVTWRAAAGLPGAEARLCWGVVGDDFLIEWREEGCGGGVAPPELEPAISSSRPDEGGSLARLLLEKVVMAHGGILRCSKHEDFRVVLRWPRMSKTSDQDG